jgi:hypothetical protein
MKLILDFNENWTVIITSTDDLYNYYQLTWGEKDGEYNLWYNAKHVWTKKYESTPDAISSVVGYLLSAMKVN